MACNLIRGARGVAIILHRQIWWVSTLAWLAACAIVAPATCAQRRAPGIELAAPIVVYLSEPGYGAFASAGTLASAPPFSEDRALQDIDQLVRLKKSGLRVDYDLLDASAIMSDGLHPTGRTVAWPNGPDAWIARCRAAGIRPSLRFTASSLQPDFISALQSWYDRGVRLFAFDGPGNLEALDAALTAFRARNHDAVLLAIENNGSVSHASPAFLLLSTGPPQPANEPQANLQRAIDIEIDGQVRHDEQTGVALAHILSAGFIAAPASEASPGAASPGASGVPRGLQRDWKGAFVLSMARGGWVDTLSGSLDSIESADARWMARVQKLFFAIEARGRMRSFGGAPSSGQPYGFTGETSRGAVYVVVNPTQTVATLLLSDPPALPGRILFRDAGFSPRLNGNAITLGPGQIAVVGFGAYAAPEFNVGPEFNLGIDQDVVIPRSIEPINANFQLTAPGVLEARIDPPIQGVLRVIVRESDSGGGPATADPHASRNHRFTLEITQGGRPIPLRPEGAGSDGESTLSAGLSWAVAEIDVNDLTPGVPLRVLFRSDEKSAVTLEGSAYQVIY
jgi:hypothetical protein